MGLGLHVDCEPAAEEILDSVGGRGGQRRRIRAATEVIGLVIEAMRQVAL